MNSINLTPKEIHALVEPKEHTLGQVMGYTVAFAIGFAIIIAAQYFLIAYWFAVCRIGIEC